MKEIFEAMIAVLFVAGICGCLIGAFVHITPLMFGGVGLMTLTYSIAKKEDKKHARP